MFSRRELQDIRDRARAVSVKNLDEQDAFEEIALAADRLDAHQARRELDEMVESAKKLEDLDIDIELLTGN